MKHTALTIQSVPITKINPAPYNPRKDLQPSDPEYQRLERSLGEFGCVEPLVWNKKTGHLVGGHQRFKILKARGDTHVEVSVVSLSLVKEKALNIALNKITGDWDDQKLAELLRELLDTPELDLSITGFEVPDARDLIAEILGQGSQEEQFDVAAALESAGPPITKPGELIILGRTPGSQHRLLCGDCTDPAQVRRLMGKDRAALFATDPPYLVGYTGTQRPGAGVQRTGNKASTHDDWDDPDANPELYQKFLATAIAEALRPNAAMYIWHASRRQGMLEAAMAAVGALVHCQIIWVKNRAAFSRSWYGWRHEPCLMGWLKGRKPPRTQSAVLSTVWEIDTIPNGPERPDHPTPKPLEVFQIPMLQHTRPGEVCFEPFAGSGTQIIAAQRLGRRCLAMEISPVYCDVIVRRFIAFAGAAAVDPRIARRYRVQEAAA